MSELQELYDSIPAIACKRRCWRSCGPIFMSAFEHRRITLFHGEHYIDDGPVAGMCPFLTDMGSCSIYAMRPLICRLWGVVDNPGMRCPEGCEPERWLTDADAKALIDRATALSAGPMRSTDLLTDAAIRAGQPFQLALQSMLLRWSTP